MAAIEEAKAKIGAALRGRANGVTSGEIRESAGIAGAAVCKRAIAAMKKAGELLAHEGESPRKTRYSLNPEQIADSPSRKPASIAVGTSGNRASRSLAATASARTDPSRIWPSSTGTEPTSRSI